ncbi:MAG TPA: hypothetical protein VNV36_05325 [Pseudomonas sp.]|uniref:hypothetical protein n=1 Tax=Pseudomonas sp. TaxID=306 RepID=UPI002C99A3F7|nr:hypothetical protein [Pseudomonas sp.]HWH86183.1 hypothetical protein [Pseudomonas sp.]
MSSERLIQLAALLLQKHAPLEIGDHVKWKDGLANQPIEGLMIISGLVEDDNTTHGFYTPVRAAIRLDATVAYLNGEGELVEAYIDSRRVCRC